MQLIENRRYRNILENLHKNFPHWEMLRGKSIFLSGATGLIGSFLVDAVMLRNRELPPEDRCGILAVGRSLAAAEKRFRSWQGDPAFSFLEHDVGKPLEALPWEPDYWIHAASTSHHLAFSTEPIDTILVNVLGTRNLLERASRREGGRFLLLSSGEIYGENRGDVDWFTEEYCGNLDCNTLRAGYPEGKRVSESLCQAYASQTGIETTIIRLPRCYGPSMQMKDSKAAAQFIKKGILGENVVLKSKGEQLFSFTHVADAVCGMLWVLLRGESGQAYNLGDKRSDITLKDLAGLVAKHSGAEVVFDLPSDIERRGYSTARKALLDGSKLKRLGWEARYDIASGICETIDILREVGGQEAARL
jgi:UDP-glucuronate decarboxylase|nr:NAD-dependent epimerase/dehydratase family protein [uncultured Acetatifactor sp.]